MYFETYGCQMNVNDTDIAWTVLKNAGFKKTDEINQVSFSYVHIHVCQLSLSLSLSRLMSY